MSDMTVASTTDTQADINRAVGVIDKPEVDTEKPEQETTEQKTETQETQPKPSKSAEQRRWDRKTRELNDAKRELEAVKQRLAALEKPAAETAATEEAKPETKELVKPKPDDFKTWEEYMDALADYKFEEKVKAESERQKQATEQQRQASEAETTFKAHQARIEEARERYDDWDEVAERAARIELPAAAQVAIVNLENGPDVLYYLATHKEEAIKIVAMDGAKIVLELGRISARLEPVTKEEIEEEEREETKPIARKSAAPAPIKPVGGSATRSSLPIDELPYQEYRRIRDQQAKANYRR